MSRPDLEKAIADHLGAMTKIVENIDSLSDDELREAVGGSLRALAPTILGPSSAEKAVNATSARAARMSQGAPFDAFRARNGTRDLVKPWAGDLSAQLAERKQKGRK
ncbi:MAG TPA: hypothetical protein VHB21_11395 [Minicystis sp.]|nr:hypothetical protein [Minicystis sp.]